MKKCVCAEVFRCLPLLFRAPVSRYDGFSRCLARSCHCIDPRIWGRNLRVRLSTIPDPQPFSAPRGTWFRRSGMSLLRSQNFAHCNRLRTDGGTLISKTGLELGAVWWNVETMMMVVGRTHWRPE
jgi:hypothetical protein